MDPETEPANSFNLEFTRAEMENQRHSLNSSSDSESIQNNFYSPYQNALSSLLNSGSKIKIVTAYLTTVYLILLTTFLASRLLGRTCPKSVQTFSQILLVNSTLVILFPPLAFLYCAILLYRSLLSLYFKIWLRGEVKMMEPLDVAWAAESHAQCNHFTSLYVLEGHCNVQDIQRRILGQLVNKRDGDGKLIYDRIKYCAKKKFGFYCWERDTNFNVTHHVRLIDETRDPEMEFSESDIFDEIEKFADTPMNSARPQWEILIAPNFVYNDEKMKVRGEEKKKYYAIIFRIHHSICDGVSAGHALKHALADSPMKFSVDPLKSPNVNKRQKLLVFLHAIAFGVVNIFNSMTLNDTNCFHKAVLTGPKKFGWSRPIDLKALKAIKMKTTTTAVLMSCIGGSIRKLAIEKNLTVPRRIHAATTVALLPYPSIRPQNRFVLVHYPLDIGLGSSVERMESAHDTAMRLSTSSCALVNFTMTRLGGRLPAFLADFLMGLLRATIILSNVPGPCEPATLFGGHLLIDGVFWIPLKNWTGMGACLFSYNGRVRAAFVGDKSSVPDALDVSNLIKGFESEILHLAKMAGVDPDAVFWTPGN